MMYYYTEYPSTDNRHALWLVFMMRVGWGLSGVVATGWALRDIFRWLKSNRGFFAHTECRKKPSNLYTLHNCANCSLSLNKNNVWGYFSPVQ